MIYATISRPSGRNIVYLNTIRTLYQINHEVSTIEDLHTLIQDHNVEAVMFGVYGLPRRAVPVGVKADAAFAKMLRMLAAADKKRQQLYS